MRRSARLMAASALSLTLCIALSGCGADGTPLRPGSAAQGDVLPVPTMTLGGA